MSLSVSVTLIESVRAGSGIVLVEIRKAGVRRAYEYDYVTLDLINAIPRVWHLAFL